MNDLELIKEKNWSNMSAGQYFIIPLQIVKLVGTNSTVLLSYLVRKERYFETREELTDDGFFFNTSEDIKINTFLSREKQDLCLKKLKEFDLIETKIQGVPPRKHFKINHLSLTNQFAGNTQINLRETHKSICVEGTTTNKTILIKKLNVASQIQKIPVASQDRGFAPTLNKRRLIKKKQSKREIIRTNNPFLVKKAIFKKKRKILVPKITNDIQTIVDYWISKGMKSHRENTLSFAQVIRDINSLLNGTLFNNFKNKMWHNRKFRIPEIKKTIDNFVLAAYNVDYEPIA